MVPERNMSAFHAMKNFGLNFQEFPETNGTAISGIQEKRATLRGTQNFSEVIVLWLSSRNSSRNFGSMARCTEIQQFPEFLEPFPGNYRTVSKCLKFLVKWKAPMFSVMENLALYTISYIILGVNLSSLTNQNREQVPVSISSSQVKRGTAFIIHLVQQGRGFAYQRAGYFHVSFQWCYMKCCPTL